MSRGERLKPAAAERSPVAFAGGALADVAFVDDSFAVDAIVDDAVEVLSGKAATWVACFSQRTTTIRDVVGVGHQRRTAASFVTWGSRSIEANAACSGSWRSSATPPCSPWFQIERRGVSKPTQRKPLAGVPT
jgi:hypothetical protein